MSKSCHFCRREFESESYFIVGDSAAVPMDSHVVWVDTSLGHLCVCSLCYEHGRFEGLSPQDVGALHYMFADPYSEDSDDWATSVERLQRAFALCPCPEIEGALGYAYWKHGRTSEAVVHCRSSLIQQPNHFGASKAFYVLKREDPEVGSLTARLRAAGQRIKSVAAEFPCHRIKKPKHEA